MIFPLIKSLRPTPSATRAGEIPFPLQMPLWTSDAVAAEQCIHFVTKPSELRELARIRPHDPKNV